MKRFTVEQVELIKKLIVRQVPDKEICYLGNVAQSSLRQMKAGNYWKEVPFPSIADSQRIRLTEDTARQVKQDIGNKVERRITCNNFDITVNTYYHIKSGRAWANVPFPNQPKQEEIKKPRRKKLTEIRVLEVKIRLRQKQSITSIAKLMNIDVSLVSNIHTGKRFADIKI